MAVSVTFNGSTYSIPSNRQAKGWGASLSSFLVAVGNNALSKAGGSFVLTADVNFGATNGLIVSYLKSISLNIAQSGVVRLARADQIVWRNEANNADLALDVNSSNVLRFNGTAVFLSGQSHTLLSDIGTNSHTQIDNHIASTSAHGVSGAIVGTSDSQTLTNKTIVSPVINTSISGTALETNLGTSATTYKVATAAAVKAYVDAQIASVSGAAPAGMVVPFAGASAPSGWLLCDGTNYSRTTYANLFAAIGTTYDTQINPTTGLAWSAPAGTDFRVPDYRGVFLRGVGTPSGQAAVTLGGHQTDQNKAHTHSVSGTTGAGGAHSHSVTYTYFTATLNGTDSATMQPHGAHANGNTGQAAKNTGNESSHTHSFSTTSGSEGGTETRPLNKGVNYIIKF